MHDIWLKLGWTICWPKSKGGLSFRSL